MSGIHWLPNAYSNRRTLYASFALLVFALAFLTYSPRALLLQSFDVVSDQRAAQIDVPSTTTYDNFGLLKVEGFDGTGGVLGSSVSGDHLCHTFHNEGEIKVQESFALHDDLFEVATSLDNDPIVRYVPNAFGDARLSLKDIIARTWDELAIACVFLQDQQVFLCVSRVVFHPETDVGHPKVSFLRGRIFSKTWTHLANHKLKWGDQETVFPKVFDIEVDDKPGGKYLGPEDARILIEDVPGAEPVIIFNMMSPKVKWNRAMWLFRPFSQHMTLLEIRDVERQKVEKNWVPFFISDASNPAQPSTHIHFASHLAPLTVLKCHLETGICETIFTQRVSDELLVDYKDSNSTLNGGTPFLPIPRTVALHGDSLNANTQAYFSFPRHHVKKGTGCRGATYRPELAILVTNTTHFYFSYISAPIDFGPGAVVADDVLHDICGKGRIMIVNSIVHWDFEADLSDDIGRKVDVMTLTLSMNDRTSQVIRVAGLYDLMRSLPSLRAYFDQRLSQECASKDFPCIAGPMSQSAVVRDAGFDALSDAGWSIRSCVEEEAVNYITTHKENLV